MMLLTGKSTGTAASLAPEQEAAREAFMPTAATGCVGLAGEAESLHRSSLKIANMAQLWSL